MVSAALSFTLYFLIRFRFTEEYRELIPKKIEILYKLFGKPVFFIFDPEWVHDNAMHMGEFFGKISIIKSITAYLFRYSNKFLSQKIEGIIFKNPVGLAAGYDYEAAFPFILPEIGFGFETIGTITRNPSEGNAKPRLGRLPKSKSLLVNKGFKNIGSEKVIKKLHHKKFDFPVGISIGVTNNAEITTLSEAIEDILFTYKAFEHSRVKHAYYELNISCPNLKTKVTFYDAKGLKALLDAIAKLRLRSPVFIKMPIDHTNEEITAMLDVILKYSFVKGVIFGNLQKNRKDKAFVKEEITKMGKGNFSGKPTFQRSNELIQLAYKKCGKKIVIIGCGGIFSAEDAYTKIKLGASVVQLITGMIFVGPQLISQINRGLVDLAKKDGYSHISEAIGVAS
jgi:dihydroorotate dehydrogenase subfamily 2